MDPKSLLNADYLDIIYDKRNKKYGGYELRRHYNRRIKKAGAFTLAGVVAILSFSFINNDHAGNIHLPSRSRPDSISVVIIPVHPIEKPKIQPPTPAVAHLKMKSVTIPKIEPDKDVPVDKLMTENKNLVNIQPGPVSRDGDTTGFAPMTSTGSGTGVDKSLPAKSSGPARYVEQMPQFVGDMNAYISSHIHYPESARSDGIQGSVIIEFVVNEDGSVNNAKVLRGIGGGCDEEALRMVSSMPKWKPGKQNGTPVKVYFTLPIRFELD